MITKPKKRAPHAAGAPGAGGAPGAPGAAGGNAAGGFAQTRQRLLDRRGELQAQLQALQSDQRRGGGPLSADFAEQASERENDEVIDALLIRARRELGDVSHALARIEAGSYGRCTLCGESIEPARLAAVPYTNHCGSCAESG